MVNALRRSLRLLTVALALLSLPRAAPAQERIHRTYTVDDGLVQSQVLSVFEDRNGYLWLGTFSGISRFDGVAFTNFQDPAGPAGPVNTIAQAADGTLLFGTERGVGIYADGRWSVPPTASGLTAGSVRSIVRAPDGSLLATSGQSGVVARRTDGSFAALPLPGTPKSLRGISLLAGRDRTLWLGTFSQGLWAFRDGRLAGHWTVDQGLPGTNIASLAEGPDGAVYVGTERGLAVYRAGTLAALPGWPAATIRKIAFGSDGILYAGTTAAGLLFGRPDRPPARIDSSNGLPSDLVYDVHETRGGTVYVGTERGVSPFDRGRLTAWLPRHGLPNPLVWGFAEEPGTGPETRIWMATGNGLAALENGRMMGLGRAEGLPNRTVRSLWRSPSGRLYAGTESGGVAIVENGRVIRTLGIAEGLPSPFVLAIREGRDGTVYFGTQKGLAIWRDGRFTTLGVADGLREPTVNALALAPDGSLYLATMWGLARWDGRALRVWIEHDGLADHVVWSVTVGPDGTVYAGTHRGLSILRDGRFTTFDTRRGLTDNTIYCSLLDAAGRIFVSTDRGVDLIDPRTPPGRPAVVRTLRRADGLPGEEGNLGACHQDAAGRLWFGTIAGAVVYDPAREPPRTEPPRSHITGLQLFGRDLPLPPPGAVRVFESRENYFGFSFVGIDLGAPHRVRYRYRLRGLDRGFIETDRRTVQYTNLSPGDYRFEVQATAGTGPWDTWSSAASLPFTILTPLWRRWWFLLLATLLAGATVSLLLTARVRALLAVERLRTALAADLHDHIGAGLTEISILSEIAVRRALSDGPVSPRPAPELGRMADIARQLVDRMDDIVWLVNPRRDSLHELFLRLKDSYEDLFAGSGILFRTTDLRLFEGIHLPMDYRENLHLIFKEALNNSLRHSGCREIDLHVAVVHGRLEVRLADDGRGFGPAAQKGGDGLANLRRRAESIGGVLTLTSAPGAGTEVRFSGPLRRRKRRP